MAENKNANIDDGSIIVIAQIKPDNPEIPVCDAEHIKFKDGRLNEYMPVVISKADYDALPEKNPKTPYLVYEDE